jgi:hypothetical protein
MSVPYSKRLCPSVCRHVRQSFKRLAALIALVCSVLHMAWVCAAEPATLHIRVNAANVTDNVVRQQGYLHGFSDVDYQPASLNMALLTPLRPNFWRIGFSHHVGQNYQLAKTLNPDVKITLVLSDLLAIRVGGYGKLNPWRNWARYERDVQAVVRSVNAAGYQIDYWDIWSEPDVKGFWSGNCNQVMELFSRTHRVIRAEIPHAKIVGPSISAFDAKGACKQPFLSTLVEYAQTHKLEFDALSWHEFEQPSDLVAHVAVVRKHFAERPALKMPEIHINEYSGPAQHASPGVAVHWLQALEKARVDWSSRACWDTQCQSGLNGLFKADNQTPNAVYWVYRAYAEMPNRRLGLTNNGEHIATIASVDNTGKKLTLLVGVDKRGLPANATLTIHVADYAMQSQPPQVDIKKIADQATPQPQSETAKLSTQADTLSFTLDNVAAGDAYWIEITSN